MTFAALFTALVIGVLAGAAGLRWLQLHSRRDLKQRVRRYTHPLLMAVVVIGFMPPDPAQASLSLTLEDRIAPVVQRIVDEVAAVVDLRPKIEIQDVEGSPVAAGPREAKASEAGDLPQRQRPTPPESPPVPTPRPQDPPPRPKCVDRPGICAQLRAVFGADGEDAITVAWCESRMRVDARNGQYRGLMQMGSWERENYGHGPGALAQIEAAYSYFEAAGGWGPWECKP